MRTPLEIAQLAALAGGAALEGRAGDTGAVRSKGSPTDFVTEADIASGLAVVRTILAHDPRARIVVEEPEVCHDLGVEPGTLDDARVWVVDPLDGTTSFLHGFPCYSVSVALVCEGRSVAGAVYNAATAKLFSAAVGEGATCEGEVLRCASASTVQEALLVTGFPYDRGLPLDRQLAVLAAFLRAPVHGIRRDGSAAIDCCHVASGQADGFWEYALKPWDMAAGALICAEAGARVTDLDGVGWTSASRSICVANPVLHDQMLDVIASAEAATPRS
ncbi:MAG: inositol monophosphatase family protein [Coriobacteriia bacterium]|nr:inositol monophosphatase family protein [Coriobacteriia bacterium]